MTTEENYIYNNWLKKIAEKDYQVMIQAINSLAEVDLIIKDGSCTDGEKIKKIRFAVLMFQGKSNIDF